MLYNPSVMKDPSFTFNPFIRRLPRHQDKKMDYIVSLPDEKGSFPSFPSFPLDYLGNLESRRKRGK